METKIRSFVKPEMDDEETEVQSRVQDQGGRPVRERGVSVAEAGRDMDVDENVLRKWVKEFGSDPVQAFPGAGR